MSRTGDKNITISFRCNEELVDKIERLEDKILEHSAYYNFSRSKLITKAIEYITHLNLDDRDVFIKFWGSCYYSSFEND